MDIYHGWCDLKDGVSDMEFADAFMTYMEKLKADGFIEGYRLTRRKLGLGGEGLGEFHFMIEVEGLAQLDEAFGLVASRAAPVEGIHFAVNSLIKNVRFALYRDFPDPGRVQGEELF
jgi:Family of unknown function (DUF6614)